jgi:hypothetical protein
MAFSCTVVSVPDLIGDHLGEVGGLRRPRAGRHGKALLQQRHQALLAHPLAPAGQRRTVKGQLMLEELRAAEALVIGVLEPALA